MTRNAEIFIKCSSLLVAVFIFSAIGFRAYNLLVADITYRQISAENSSRKPPSVETLLTRLDRLEEALEHEPEQAAHHILMAKTYSKLGLSSKHPQDRSRGLSMAAEAYRKAIVLNPYNPYVRVEFLAFKLNAGLFDDETLELFDQQLSVAPRKWKMNTEISLTYMRYGFRLFGSFSKAIEVVQRMHKDYPYEVAGLIRKQIEQVGGCGFPRRRGVYGNPVPDLLCDLVVDGGAARG